MTTFRATEGHPQDPRLLAGKIALEAKTRSLLLTFYLTATHATFTMRVCRQNAEHEDWFSLVLLDPTHDFFGTRCIRREFTLEQMGAVVGDSIEFKALDPDIVGVDADLLS